MTELSTLDALNQRVLFLHIPKTGGVSFRSIIGQYFSVDSILHVEDPERFKNVLPRIDLRRYRFIHGHFGTDYMDYISGRNISTVTLLRDPVSRVISTYYFWKSYDYASVKTGPKGLERLRLARQLPLDAFMHSDHSLLKGMRQNRMVKMLTAGKTADDLKAQRAPGRAWLESAKERLASLEFVGTTERMHESLTVLCARFGWAPVRQPPRLNVTANRPRSKDVDPTLRSYLMEENCLDIELYDYANELLTGKYSIFQNRNMVSEFEQQFTALYPDKPTEVEAAHPLIGTGWYERETDGKKWWRWSGPGDTATVYLRVRERNDRTLQVSMPHIVTLDNVNRLRVSVNGRELETRKWQKPDGAYMVEAQVPGHLLVKRGFARIDLMCTPRALCDVIPGWPDRRLLGITMDRISLSPVG